MESLVNYSSDEEQDKCRNAILGTSNHHIKQQRHAGERNDYLPKREVATASAATPGLNTIDKNKLSTKNVTQKSTIHAGRSSSHNTNRKAHSKKIGTHSSTSNISNSSNYCNEGKNSKSSNGVGYVKSDRNDLLITSKALRLSSTLMSSTASTQLATSTIRSRMLKKCRNDNNHCRYEERIRHREENNIATVKNRNIGRAIKDWTDLPTLDSLSSDLKKPKSVERDLCKNRHNHLSNEREFSFDNEQYDDSRRKFIKHNSIVSSPPSPTKKRFMKDKKSSREIVSSTSDDNGCGKEASISNHDTIYSTPRHQSQHKRKRSYDERNSSRSKRYSRSRSHTPNLLLKRQNSHRRNSRHNRGGREARSRSHSYSRSPKPLRTPEKRSSNYRDQHQQRQREHFHFKHVPMLLRSELSKSNEMRTTLSASEFGNQQCNSLITHSITTMKSEIATKTSAPSKPVISSTIQQVPALLSLSLELKDNASNDGSRNIAAGATMPNFVSLASIQTKLSTPPSVASSCGTTGCITSTQLPSYYNPSVINATKYAEQAQKRKLLWGSKRTEDSASKWGHAQFSQDSDGKVASKFMRLMGIKNSNAINNAVGTADESPANNRKDVAGIDSPATAVSTVPVDVQLRERMFSTMEKQYEVARQATHTMRGVGLGFGTQPRTF